MALLGRDTTVTGPFPDGVLLLETLAGTEALAAPFAFDLHLLSVDHDIAAEAVLGQDLAVGIKLDTGDWRYFHGVVTSFAKVGTTRLHARYAARLMPKLSLCDYTSDCRIFNDPSQDAIGIVTSVLADHGVTGVESDALVDHAYRKREYCVQYQESDLHFVQRLLEEEGIYYFLREEIVGVQGRLANLGYYSGPINGALDDATRSAIRAFRSTEMNDGSCEMDGPFLEALARAYGV